MFDGPQTQNRLSNCTKYTGVHRKAKPVYAILNKYSPYYKSNALKPNKDGRETKSNYFYSLPAYNGARLQVHHLLLRSLKNEADEKNWT